MNKVKLIVMITPEQKKWLHTRSKKEGLALGEIIRNIISFVMKKPENKPAE